MFVKRFERGNWPGKALYSSLNALIANSISKLWVDMTSDTLGGQKRDEVGEKGSNEKPQKDQKFTKEKLNK